MRKARTEGIAGHGAARSAAGSPPTSRSATPQPGWRSRSAPPSTGIKAGQLVATGGAGKASHAEFQAVPGLLCAAVPEHVPAQDAAFATLASIPLHALRLSEAGPGAKVVVLGLGLLGQLAARLAMASGCDVAGIDPDPFAIKTRGRGGRAGPGGVGSRDHRAGPALVPGPGRGRGAGVRGGLLAAADDPDAGTVPGPRRAW